MWARSVGSRSRYYNPDTLARLIWKANESTIVIDGQKHIALIDSGAQVTTITAELVKKSEITNPWVTYSAEFPRYGEGGSLTMGM